MCRRQQDDDARKIDVAATAVQREK